MEYLKLSIFFDLKYKSCWPVLHSRKGGEDLKEFPIADAGEGQGEGECWRQSQVVSNGTLKMKQYVFL